MPLVEYSDSESEQAEDEQAAAPPPAKKLKTPSALPPLPATFRDLYSSTVRASTQDDPSLHGGRKRVVPHVQGNWPTHVYLEWCPEPEEYDALALLVEAQQRDAKTAVKSRGSDVASEQDVHSLLHNDLGVSLPLHISLSRPLVLKTEQKDGFVPRIKQAITSSGARAFDVSPADLKWHPNEDRTRWFLVVRVNDTGGELLKLLQACNNVATVHDQPKLYEDDRAGVTTKGPEADQRASSTVAEKFHISIAWSLRPPAPISNIDSNPSTSLPRLAQELRIPFEDVKVRIGQDVTSLPLVTRRQRRGS